MHITLPYKSIEGHEYLIKLESLDKTIFPSDLDIEVVGVILEVVNDLKIPNSRTTLNALSRIIINFLNENDNIVLYYLCDKDCDIISRMHPRREGVTPQEYRNMIFSKMFECAFRNSNENQYIDKPIEINSEDEIYYIHLICRNHHCKYLDSIEETITILANQMK